MRNPNGIGSVDKLPGVRRKPYRARVTIGYDSNGLQKRKTIGYFTSRKEAMITLYNFEKVKDEVQKNNIIFSDVYQGWKKNHFINLSENTKLMYNTAYNNLKPLHNRIFNDIRPLELQEVFNCLNISSGSKRPVKTLLNMLYKYAMMNEIVIKDHSRSIEMEKIKPVINRRVFTEREIGILWSNCNDNVVMSILIMIYTGIRIGEFLSLEKKEINIKDRYFICGIKTKCGKNRVVPIHKRIMPLIKKMSDIGFDYFDKMKYAKYRSLFYKVLSSLEICQHTIHDCRHTFASLISRTHANESAIRKIIGHSSFETTEKIYVHKDLKDLRQAIDMLE